MSDTSATYPGIRWGIMGSANIAKKNCRAIDKAENGVVVAVSSRDMARAEAFASDDALQLAKKWEKFRTYSDHQMMLDSPDVDAVYIPMPTGVRKEWVVKAAQAKKHVLCEKPCAVSTADLQEMIDACQQNNVQFMDGVMFSHHARLRDIKEKIADHSFGTVKNIAAHFTFPGMSNADFSRTDIRMNPDMEPLGSLGDLGWYCIRFALEVFNVDGKGGAQVPTEVACFFDEEMHEKHPLSCSGIIKFSSKGSCTFHAGFGECFDQRASVFSDTKSLHVDDFVLCLNDKDVMYTIVENTSFENFERQYCTSEHHIHNCNQEACMIQDFGRLALSLKDGKTSVEASEHNYWTNLSLQTQRVVSAAQKSALSGGKPVLL